MPTTDKIADLLTRIRNSSSVGHDYVKIPSSNMKSSIVQILLEEGYIRKFYVLEDRKQNILKVYLKYKNKRESVIKGLKRISKPGLRNYSSAEKMSKVLGGLGIAIVSTSKGIMTDKKAKKENVGGEILAHVW
ncbi:MAG: 30S ribosomal protein S8 [Candidatus Paraimprobicoccus trichonymphae]|uniref:Small ribosomal subunit protein uS8 n=1 Tax=Candidatus Paraimprobicoccus trichonymphae TaxID=3033793 RepID=A0AA48IC59_9FIRM|nr:MAG: 30S ribosomal protein S8 [Candidatus Paraimprobicoccus trichonymphae]